MKYDAVKSDVIFFVSYLKIKLNEHLISVRCLSASVLSPAKAEGRRYFPGVPVVENPSCSVGGMDLIPGLGTRIPYSLKQLSQCAAARESMHCNERSHMTQ